MAPGKAHAAAAPARSNKATADKVGEQRIYHVTHIRNLAGILNSGAVLADQSDAGESRPAVDISSAENREARRTTLVSGPGSVSVAHYVPFFLSPDSTLWNSIRSHQADSRLSADAHGSVVSDFVVLVSSVKQVSAAQTGDEETRPEETRPEAFAVTDGDAAATLTRFAATREAGERMLQKLRTDREAILQAELLVGEAFPFDRVSLIGVANDRVRDTVRGLLASSAYRPKIAVHPPWFQPAEENAL